jgi:hypothetical protein
VTLTVEAKHVILYKNYRKIVILQTSKMHHAKCEYFQRSFLFVLSDLYVVLTMNVSVGDVSFI